MADRKKSETQAGENLAKPNNTFSSKFWLAVGMGLTRCFTRLRYEGLENLPEGKYVLAANHVTLVDGLWIRGGLPKKQQKQFAALAGSDITKTFGLFGRIMMSVGNAIPIDRFGNPIRGLITAKKAVDNGSILLVHPEGTRSHDGKLGKILDGVAYVAKKSNAPMVPVYIHGGYAIFSRHYRLPHPFRQKPFGRRHLVIEFGKPLNPADYENVKAIMHDWQEWALTRQNQDASSEH